MTDAADAASESVFHRLLAERPFLLADGAMGTSLFKRGLESGDCPEFWNLDHPDRVESVHREFVDAGADIILTNSFGGNSFRLKLHDAQDRARELCAAGARLARGVADAAGRPVIVAGSMGPSGELFRPVGALSHEEGVAAFREQAEGLVEGGADILWIETMSGREEIAAAVEAAASTGKPVVATMTFDTAGHTMMGLTPAQAYSHLAGLSAAPAAIGANCGLGATENVLSVVGMRDVVPADAVVVAKANCGVPEFRDGAFRYTGTAELMADYARLARDSGARIVGGCCGTDGPVLAAMRAALEGYTPGAPPTLETVVEKLGPLAGVTDKDPAAEAAGSGAGGGRRGTGRRRRRG